MIGIYTLSNVAAIVVDELTDDYLIAHMVIGDKSGATQECPINYTEDGYPYFTFDDGLDILLEEVMRIN